MRQKVLRAKRIMQLIEKEIIQLSEDTNGQQLKKIKDKLKTLHCSANLMRTLMLDLLDLA